MNPDADDVAVRGGLRMVKRMERKGEIRELGVIREDWVARFGRLQRRVNLVAPPRLRVKGVQRFRTWEEFAAWTRQAEGK